MSSDSFRDLIDKATAFAGTDTEADKGTHAYFAPSDEPLGWQTKGKVVRLDVAIYGLHLFAARVSFRSMAGQIRQQQLTLARSIGVPTAKFAVAKLATAVFSAIFESLKIIENQFRSEQVQQDIEKAIRRHSITVQRDLFKSALGKGKRARKTRWVWSRHKTPRQRAANTTWKP